MILEGDGKQRGMGEVKSEGGGEWERRGLQIVNSDLQDTT